MDIGWLFPRSAQAWRGTFHLSFSVPGLFCFSKIIPSALIIWDQCNYVLIFKIGHQTCVIFSLDDVRFSYMTKTKYQVQFKKFNIKKNWGTEKRWRTKLKEGQWESFYSLVYKIFFFSMICLIWIDEWESIWYVMKMLKW